jgi:hypothetical protein
VRLRGLTLVLLLSGSGLDSPAAAAGRTYLILPFENTAEDPSLDWLSTGLALTLGEYLLGLGERVVDEDDRAVLLEGSGIPAGAPVALASALELGRRMRARPGSPHGRPDRLILGRFNLLDGGLTLSARAIDLEVEKARPWVTRDGRLQDLMEVQNALALALAREEGIQITGSRGALLEKQAGGVPLLAFETYCRALAESDARKRLQMLRRALQQFPGYPKAAFQAASLLVKEERWDEAVKSLEQASAAPHPYEAEFSLLSATVALQKRDARAALEAARRALQHADTARGHALLGRALLASGDGESARAELDRALALDPNEPEIDDLRRALEAGPRPTRRNP